MEIDPEIDLTFLTQKGSCLNSLTFSAVVTSEFIKQVEEQRGNLGIALGCGSLKTI